MQRKSIWTGILRWMLLVFGFIPAVLLLIMAALAFYDHATAPVLRTEVTVEAGSVSVDPCAFRTNDQDPDPVFLAGVSREQLCTPGSYAVALQCGRRSYEARVHVVDTVAPTGTTRDLTSQGEMPSADDFIAELHDVTPVSVSYKTMPDMTQNGVQTVSLLLTDSTGNRTTLTATLTLDLDITPPVIDGVHTFLVYQGDTVAYRTGITVTDDRDEAPLLSIDTGMVDLSSPGEYPVIYRATDAAGNTATAETTITVREKLPGYVSLDIIFAEVDAILAKIIKEDMTVRQQCAAIYNWVRSNCYYVNHSEKNDYYQGAYVMMTQRKGDCFNYYSLCKLMFERLGIPHIDVFKVKVRPQDAAHYWHLVSLDGGETWYHFDSVPRLPEASFFLVTDAYLDAYSEANNDCFNRDKSLYPATPAA